MRYPFVIGVISDTHGLLRPQAVEALRGSSMILHAGDIGDPEIIPALGKIAPVRAIRGNVDTGTWARKFPETEIVEAGAFTIYMLHDRNALDLDPRAAGFHAVISGHSHRPQYEIADKVLYFNAGSAGPARFRLPVSVGRITVTRNSLKPELIILRV
jgi:putative phosphoesterase